MKDNIVLIGMPGVGKSTVGVVLAKALGYNFVDADLVIQQQTGKLLCCLLYTSDTGSLYYPHLRQGQSIWRRIYRKKR